MHQMPCTISFRKVALKFNRSIERCSIQHVACRYPPTWRTRHSLTTVLTRPYQAWVDRSVKHLITVPLPNDLLYSPWVKPVIPGISKENKNGQRLEDGAELQRTRAPNILFRPEWYRLHLNWWGYADVLRNSSCDALHCSLDPFPIKICV